MKTTILLASSLALLAPSLLAGCNDKPLTLTAENTEIVIAKDAPNVVRFAAQEMTNFLSRVLGGEVPIVDAEALRVDKEKNPSSSDAVSHRVYESHRVHGSYRVRLYLGDGPWARKARLDLDALKEDGYFIKTVPDGVIIAGKDDACGDPQRAIRTGRLINARRGTMNGVYAFLERFAGCRFYFPGELGEIVPRRNRIEVAADIRDEPDYDYRDSCGPYGGSQWFAPWLRNYRPPRMLNWYRLRISGRERPFVHGLRHYQLRRRFAKDHPEWFVGKDGVDICWTSGVRDEIAKDAIAYFKGRDAASRGYIREPKVSHDAKGWPTAAFFPRQVSISADDGYVPCPCAKCKAIRARWKGGARSNSSELVWRGYDSIARQVKKAGAKGLLHAAAYSAYAELPDIPLSDNLLVACARMGGWSLGAKDRYRQELDSVKAWSERAHAKVHLHNWTLKWSRTNIPGLPCTTPRAVAQYYRDAAPYARSVLNETSSERFAHTYLNDYIMAHVTWDTSFDDERALDEHHRLMFGAAAPEMKKFYDEIEWLWINKVEAGELVMMPDGPKVIPPNYYEIWRDIYSPAKVAAWTALFDAAEGKTRGLQFRRVRLMRAELLEPLAKLSHAFVEDCDVARAERRRKESGAKNLLPEGLSFRIVAKDEQEMKKLHSHSIPFAFKPNTTYRLSCYVRTKDVVEKWWHSTSGATIGVWDDYKNWILVPGPIAIRGSTGGWVHASKTWRMGGKVTAKCVDVWLRSATGEMEVKGLFLEEINGN